MPFVLASNNAGKLREFSVLFDSMGLDVVVQRDYGVVDAEETGLSFIENALIKARHAATETNLPAIAIQDWLYLPWAASPVFILLAIQAWEILKITISCWPLCRVSQAKTAAPFTWLSLLSSPLRKIRCRSLLRGDGVDASR